MALNKKALVSNILCEEEEDGSEGEELERYVATKRNILLSPEEVTQLKRTYSAPANYQVFPAIFFPQVTKSIERTSSFSTNAPEFVPMSISEFAQYRGQIASMALDQMGSRFIQEKLEVVSLSDRYLVFDEIVGSELDLTCDIFGNYVVQKLFQLGSVGHIGGMAHRLLGHVPTIAFHMYGCRVAQAAITYAQYPDKLLIADELTQYIEQAITNQNATHVLQKCIIHLKPEDLQALILTCSRAPFEYSMNQHGCMVIQKLIEHCPRHTIFNIVQVLAAHSLEASSDPYGNYVIQYLIEKGLPADRETILAQLSGHLQKLSRHKFSSNVIEKLIAHATPAQVNSIASELFLSSDLFSLMIDKFGNFVIQKVMEAADRPTRVALFEKVQSYTDNLRMYAHGKHVLAFVDKLKRST